MDVAEGVGVAVAEVQAVDVAGVQEVDGGGAWPGLVAVTVAEVQAVDVAGMQAVDGGGAWHRGRGGVCCAQGGFHSNAWGREISRLDSLALQNAVGASAGVGIQEGQGRGRRRVPARSGKGCGAWRCVDLVAGCRR